MRGSRTRIAHSQVAKTAGFALNMLLLAVAGLAMIPSLLGSLGPQQWATVAVAQAIGGFCGVITGYGWGLAGPTYVARASKEARVARYLESLYGRALVALVTFPTGAALVALSARGVEAAPLVAFVVTAAVALSPAWFYVGTSMPWTLILVDTVPRISATICAIILLDQGFPAPLALLVQLLGIILGIVVATLLIGGSVAAQDRIVLFGTILAALRKQAHGVLAASSSAAFVALPVMIVAFVSPTTLPVYAVFDKVQRQFSSAVSPIVQVSQGYAARSGQDRRVGATRKVVLLVVALALIAVVAFAVFGQMVLHLLAAQQLHFSFVQVVVLALVLGAVLVEQAFGYAVLAPHGLTRALAKGTLVGASVGLMLIAIAAFFGDATWALIAFGGGLLLTLGLEIDSAYRASVFTAGSAHAPHRTRRRA